MVFDNLHTRLLLDLPTGLVTSAHAVRTHSLAAPVWILALCRGCLFAVRTVLHRALPCARHRHFLTQEQAIRMLSEQELVLPYDLVRPTRDTTHAALAEVVARVLGWTRGSSTRLRQHQPATPAERGCSGSDIRSSPLR